MSDLSVNPEELDIYSWAMDQIGQVGWNAGLTGEYDHERSKFWHEICHDLEEGSVEKAGELHHLYQLRQKLFPA